MSSTPSNLTAVPDAAMAASWADAAVAAVLAEPFVWRHAPRDALLWLLRGYRFFLSPWLGSACRFEPTCSRYGLQAVAQHGAAAGSYLTVARLLRCHPGCAGGCDAVPRQRPRLFRHLLADATRTLPTELAPSVAPATPDSLTTSRPLS